MKNRELLTAAILACAISIAFGLVMLERSGPPSRDGETTDPTAASPSNTAVDPDWFGTFGGSSEAGSMTSTSGGCGSYVPSFDSSEGVPIPPLATGEESQPEPEPTQTAVGR